MTDSFDPGSFRMIGPAPSRPCRPRNAAASPAGLRMEGSNSTRSSDAVVAPAAGAAPGGVGPGRAHARGGVSARLVAMLILLCPALAVVGAVSWGVLLGRQSAAEQQKRLALTVATALAEPIRGILEGGNPALLPSLLYQ